MAERVAIVTGASSGLGLQLSAGLLQRGYAVVGVSRSQSPELDVVIRSNSKLVAVPGDVSDEDTAQRAFAQAERLGDVSLLINCAGVGVFGEAGTFTRDDIDTVLAGNFMGTVLFCEAAVRCFAQKGGAIVNVMSTAALLGRAREAIYCASKWAVRGYTEALRVELKGKPVNIVAVYPGGMETPFWHRARRSATDGKGFMAPDEVAREILQALDGGARSYISELRIDRR